jgi:hypothetical protein
MVTASLGDDLPSRSLMAMAGEGDITTNGFAQSAGGHHHHALYVYSHPIYIPTEVTAVLYEASRWHESERTVDNELVVFQLLQLTAIAISFNPAVAFQEQAPAATSARTTTPTTMTMSSSQEVRSKIDVMLKWSLRLFQQSYKNLCWNNTPRDGTSCGNNTSSTTTLFSLAALNNVAALHKLLGESKTASAGFHDLLSSLMMCTVFETDSNKTSRYTAFFHNTAKLSYPNCSVCAGSAWDEPTPRTVRRWCYYHNKAICSMLHIFTLQ